MTEPQHPPPKPESRPASFIQRVQSFFFGLDGLPCPAFSNKHALGVYGEQVAGAFLRRHGYKPLVRNFATPWGEIDLTCRDGKVLVFVEVKSRTRRAPDRPATAVTTSKRRRMLHSAREYVRLLKEQDPPTRFDIVEVILEPGIKPQCTLIRGIMEISEKTL